MRYFIELAYNGKNYHGWQIQDNAHSVQEELQNRMKILLKDDYELVGCGRTDTGVHASQFFAHFDIEQQLSNTERFVYQLNALLPDDISIYKVFEVEPDLHARFSAMEREYEYLISTRPTPFLNELSWTWFRVPDIEKMNEAAALLLTHSDFECFSKVHTQVNTFICEVRKAEWKWKEEGLLSFTISADRFLRNMVRAIVGTLMEVGQGKMDLADFKKVLESKNRSAAGQSVPARGLYLRRISYPGIR
ncbi:tRNA pseudouridine(38-40) synthase TruA [Bacteroidota bacterium]